jgi:hypothetical protein
MSRSQVALGNALVREVALRPLRSAEVELRQHWRYQVQLGNEVENAPPCSPSGMIHKGFRLGHPGLRHGTHCRRITSWA